MAVPSAVEIANNGGKTPQNYSININELDIPDSSKTKFENKLFVDSTEGILYYDSTVVTNIEEQDWLKQIGIYEKEKAKLPQIVEFKLGNF